MTPLNNWRDSDLSALFDDELLADEAQNCVAESANNQAALARWCDYQDVRAGLQGDAGRVSSAAFLAGFRQRLAQEEQVQPQLVMTVPQSSTPAANDAVFRWKLVAGLASCASVAVLAWSLIGQSQAPVSAPVLVQAAPVMRGFASPQAIQSVSGFSSVAARPATSVAEANEQAQVMLRDPALDEFLRAHGSQAGSVMENTAGFMRNATFGGQGL